VFDVVAFEIGAAGDLRVVLGEPGAELPQGVLDVLHGRRPETQSDLVDVATRHFGDAWRDDGRVRIRAIGSVAGCRYRGDRRGTG
jgi:hypothetical protein